MNSRIIKIGSRPSRLSQAQTGMVAKLLRDRVAGARFEIAPISTKGDRSGVDRRSPGGAKGAFTGDIESKLLSGEIDLAVHSMKDLPSTIADGLIIGGTPPRADPRDALLTRRRGLNLASLPRGSRVGTGSLRRKAQLLQLKKDIEVVDLVGNVDTRIRKLATDYDAIVLAAAGLQRIGESAQISQIFSIDEMVPSVCQGILALQIRKSDHELAKALSAIEDPPTRAEAECERSFAKALGADCYVPVGCCGRVSGDSITAVGMIATEDGRLCLKESTTGSVQNAAELGRDLARSMLDAGGSKILGETAA